MSNNSAVPVALFQQASGLLDEFVRRAGLEMNVMAFFAVRNHLNELRDELLERLSAPERYPNKGYNGLAEALARCLVLYEHRPDEYARLISGVATDVEDVFLDSFEGLCTLAQVIRGLADDHSYVFNLLTGSIEVESPANAGCRGLVPAELLEIVRKRTDFIQIEPVTAH